MLILLGAVSGAGIMGVLAAAGTSQQLALVTAVTLAACLFSRPRELLLLTVVCNLAANSGVPAVGQARFLLLVLTVLSLMARWVTHPGSGRGRGDVFLAGVAAVALLDPLVRGALDEGSFRAVAFALLIAIALLLPRSLDPAQLRDLLRSMTVLLAGYLALGTMIKLAVEPATVFQPGGFAGPFANPNSLGLVAGAVVVSVLAQPNMRYRPLLLLASASAAVSSRSLGVLLAIGFVGLLTVRARLLGVAALAAATAVLLGLVGVRWYDATRFEVWTTALESAAASPLSGVGFGRTDEALRQGLLSIPLSFQGESLHNSYVQILFELGLGRGLLLLGLLALALKRLLRGANPAAQAVVVFGLVTAFSESWLTSSGSTFAVVFWIAMGGCAATPTAVAREHGDLGAGVRT